MRNITIALEQLAQAKAAQGPLPMSHAAGKRGLHAPVRTMRRAILEVSLSRAEGYHHA